MHQNDAYCLAFSIYTVILLLEARVISRFWFRFKGRCCWAACSRAGLVVESTLACWPWNHSDKHREIGFFLFLFFFPPWNCKKFTCCAVTFQLSLIFFHFYHNILVTSCSFLSCVAVAVVFSRWSIHPRWGFCGVLGWHVVSSEISKFLRVFVFCEHPKGSLTWRKGTKVCWQHHMLSMFTGLSFDHMISLSLSVSVSLSLCLPPCLCPIVFLLHHKTDHVFGDIFHRLHVYSGHGVQKGCTQVCLFSIVANHCCSWSLLCQMTLHTS